jgi:two-component system NtrC family sensor kinase
MMNAILRWMVRLVTGAVLLAGVAYLYMKSQDVDQARRDVVNAQVRELKQIDATLNLEVLRSKTGLTRNYDNLAAAQQLALKTEQELAEQNLEKLDFTLQDSVKKVAEALTAKLELVDRFKAQNAILQNSMRFIPVAAEELKAMVHEPGEANAAKRAQPAQLAEEVDRVLVETLKLQSSGDSGAIARVRGLLGAMVQRRAEYPPAVAERFDVFSNHVITILAQKEREEDLLDEIARLPVAQRVDALDGSFEASFSQANAKRDQYRTMLFGYAAFLLALFGFLLGRTGRTPAAA